MDKSGRIFSGVQPSGSLHLGNYLGALKEWVKLAQNHDAFFCVVDEHAITVPYDPQDISHRVLQTAAWYLAAGINPDQHTVFIQSHVPAHTELSWLLMTVTPFGELQRMTQFKDKSRQNIASTSAALFNYPVLMAADILLYDTDIVPVGEDQVQHIELTRDIAKWFNKRFGDTFKIPQAHINQNTARIMSLTDPSQKMSKSGTPKSYIALEDNADTIRQKIMSAVTDTKPIFSFTHSGPAVRNLLNIFQAFSEQSHNDIEKRFEHSNYQEFKTALADIIIESLAPIQTKYQELLTQDDELRILLGRGMHIAQTHASRTLTRVKQKMGLL
jgi:tryptophanyl-tRNA synthetase